MSAPAFLKNIEDARRRLAGIIRPTPLMQSATLARMLDADVRIKPENVQKTGSFKIRGAYNRIVTLSDEEKSAASSRRRREIMARRSLMRRPAPA